jgi:hypothetical protein
MFAQNKLLGGSVRSRMSTKGETWLACSECQRASLPTGLHRSILMVEIKVASTWNCGWRMLSSRLFARTRLRFTCMGVRQGCPNEAAHTGNFLGGYWLLTSSTASCKMPSQHALFTSTSGCDLTFPVWIPGCVAQIYHGAVSLVVSGNPIMTLLR